MQPVVLLALLAAGDGVVGDGDFVGCGGGLEVTCGVVDGCDVLGWCWRG